MRSQSGRLFSTPTNVRMDVCRPLFEARIPVLIEKPMCDGLVDALVLTAVATEFKCPFAVNQNFRYHYPYRETREVLQRGDLGRPLHLVQHAMYRRNNTAWRAKQSRNVMAVMSIHWLDGNRLPPSCGLPRRGRDQRLRCLSDCGDATRHPCEPE